MEAFQQILGGCNAFKFQTNAEVVQSFIPRKFPRKILVVGAKALMRWGAALCHNNEVGACYDRIENQIDTTVVLAIEIQSEGVLREAYGFRRL